MEPGHADFVKAVRSLGLRQLTDLRHGTNSLGDFEAVVREVSAVTTGSRWDIADVEQAGRRLVAEVEFLGARPVVPAVLDLVEQTIEVRDKLADHLIDAYNSRRADPDEISEPFVDAYRELCGLLGLAEEQIADRLNRLLECCHYDIVDVAAFGEFLGEQARSVRLRARW